ncbi:hypothetical protein [Streptomyces sp. NRRL S-646]|uniref:hypothetical protein n=1 Tax=Streptomyces sp. NRRL S-646 TaxID=1463917 RepID=UPI0013313E78|nr:hypothetical protein [Streptomyces sp. NRRL S-646]
MRNTRPFPAPALDELPASLREQLHAYSRLIDGRLPPEAVYVYVISRPGPTDCYCCAWKSSTRWTSP